MNTELNRNSSEPAKNISYDHEEIGLSNRAAELLTRIESVPFSRWHIKPRVIMGSATFFDAFDALSLAFVLPVLIGLWNLTPGQIGILIGSGYLGQAIGAIFF